ncbi:hypothetical protein [Mycobacteroides abscessus]|uniref:hypothetical protein n=1 Tax=Mycobacteroides abscessus TaxID=36809 RepID=UPI00092CBBD6|nr:hypothetical protein [Mycobacteroides abscessus]SIE16091.1 Uncharacterised protein [Mycobacteroides abscessus subsp. abscessus]SLC73504.1 Uncharacterised protein [Mycobacteroides abscessus subsp. massiliense]SLI83632.1 Uncharacterised protein [Mycobacteroides abscessus subsp. abscessus]
MTHAQITQTETSIASPVEFPNDWIDQTTGDWGRIHRGHGLDKAELARDLVANHGEGYHPRPGERLEVIESYYLVIPETVSCEANGEAPCAADGFRHNHWAKVPPTSAPACQFTEVFWNRSEQQ